MHALDEILFKWNHLWVKLVQTDVINRQRLILFDVGCKKTRRLWGEGSRSVLLVSQSHKSLVAPPRGRAIWPRKTFMSVYVRWQRNKPVLLLISHYRGINRTRQENSGPVVSETILTLVWNRWCKLNDEIWIVGNSGSNKQQTVIKGACYSAMFFILLWKASPFSILFISFFCSVTFSIQNDFSHTIALTLLPMQSECVFVAMAWEVAGESQGTADARSSPRWLTSG